jgi:hypothetical protein
MSVLKMYFASNDQLVSEAPTTTYAVSFTLRADLEANDSVRLYAKCDTGYQATTVTVTPEGTTATKWQLAPDVTGSAGTYEAAGDPLSLGTVTTSNTFFWAKALSTSDESIGIDTSVTLKLEGIGEAV